MEINKGKEVVNPLNNDQPQNSNKNIKRPKKIQKLAIPRMEPRQFQDHGASSSGGQHGNHDAYAHYTSEIPRTRQKSNNQDFD